MVEIEILLIFLTSLIATLTGFVGVVFIFWYNTKIKYRKEGEIKSTKEMDSIIKDFTFLIWLALVIILSGIIFVLYPKGDTVSEITKIFDKVLQIVGLILGFIWIILMGHFFITIISDVRKTLLKK